MNKTSTTLCLLILPAHFCFAQWEKTAGPPGIRATQFYEASNVLYVGTDAKGVYKSLDHGNTWIPANTGIENKTVYSLAADGTYLYAGVGATDTNTDGVYRSSNQGATWTPANTGIQNQSVYSLLVAAGQIFAGTIGFGVYRSSNQGGLWTDANGGALGSSFIFAMFYANDTLRVEADNYIFYTGDFGANWYVDQGSTSFYVIDQFCQKGDTVIAAAGGNVFWTHNGGTTWSDVIVVNPEIEISGIERRNDTLYAGHANGVYRSVNWGQSWTNIASSGLRFGNRANNDFKISGNTFLLSFEEIGIYKSSNYGMTWSQVPLNQFEAASTIDNSIIISGSTLYAGTHNDGVYASTNSGDSWNKIGTGNPLDTLSNSIVFAMLYPATNIILAGTCGYGLYRSTNNGTSWTHITAGLPSEDGFTCINTLALSGSNVIAATTQGVYYSTNNGLNWSPSNLTGGQVYASGLAVNGNIACVGISSFTFGSGIYRSTNSGVTWVQVTSSILDVICMTQGEEDHFYAGSFTGNFVSDDNGLTWSSVGPGIPADHGGFVIMTMDEYVFVGNDLGLFYSDDYGGSFTAANEGMDPYPNHSVQGLAHDATYVYAGLYNNGIWRRPVTDFGIGELCPTMVTNTNDSGAGSLREIIGCALPGANITFDAALTDQTIILTSGEIDISKNLTLSGPGMTQLTISGNSASRIFHILPGNAFVIKNMALKNATSLTDGGAIFCQGDLTLEGVLFQNNFQNGLNKALTLVSPGFVHIRNMVQMNP